MRKDIILIVLILIAVVSISGCINGRINGPIDNINSRMKDLNTDITEGDNDYNAAISSINSHDYSSANNNIQIAKEKFNDAETKLSEIEEYQDDLNESVYKEYIDLIKEEVSLKKQASDELYLAIQYYANNDPYSGNSYAKSANNQMKKAVILQGERNQLVEENSELFKKAGII